MNLQRLASAFRQLARNATTGHYATSAQALFEDAAACEEEGDTDALRDKKIATLEQGQGWFEPEAYRLRERIAALETLAVTYKGLTERIEALEAKQTPDIRRMFIGGDPPPAPEEPRCNGCRNCKKAGKHVCECHDPVPPAASEREERTLLEELNREAQDWADLADERLRLLRKVAVAEDPSEYADEVAQHLDKFRNYTPPAAASAAPSGREDSSPEQAETSESVETDERPITIGECVDLVNVIRALLVNGRHLLVRRHDTDVIDALVEIDALLYRHSRTRGPWLRPCRNFSDPHQHDEAGACMKPSPEQAQETWLCGEQERNFRCTRRKGHAGPHEDTLPKPRPEQARRTVTGGQPIEVIQHGDSLVYADSEHGKELQAEARGLPCVVVERRPGERIVSGEGVRMHRHTEAGWIVDGDPCTYCEKGYVPVRGVLYPDAPPRAEGE